MSKTNLPKVEEEDDIGTIAHWKYTMHIDYNAEVKYVTNDDIEELWIFPVRKWRVKFFVVGCELIYFKSSLLWVLLLRLRLKT